MERKSCSLKEKYGIICKMRGDRMAKRRISAQELICDRDFFHLAKEFYRYIFRHPELETDPVWVEVKAFAEDLIVKTLYEQEEETEKSLDDYRDFLRFYTRLEVRDYDEEREFVFTKNDKRFFMGLK
jgi:hypothetical protein